ncbi:MAG TPA: site-specific integrase, partial [Rubrivivax sp.]|nr:site-specific integrase [Rubrivivax sp.]
MAFSPMHPKQPSKPGASQGRTAVAHGPGRAVAAGVGSPESQALIDRFIDALWIEDGLAAQTLAAYRRDLSLFAQWL